MCKFFSFVSNSKGKYFYFNWESRKALLKNNPENYNPDSHSSIVEYYQAKGEIALGSKVEDKLNKFEYNPLTKEFKVDQINTRDDSSQAESWVKSLDFKPIVKPLIIKPLIHPFKDKNRKRVTKKDIKRLKEWSRVRDSIEEGSIRYFVWDIAGDFVERTVRESIWNSIVDFVASSIVNSIASSIRKSIYYFIRSIGEDSIGDFVRDSIMDSVHDSVYAYILSFFNIPEWKHVKHKKGVNPFQSAIDLWESGLVPSFDGKIWRLHGGPKGKVLFEISKKDLEKI